MADFNTGDVDVTIQVGLGYDISGAATVNLIASITPPAAAPIRKVFTASVGGTTITIGGTSYAAHTWAYYVTANTTDFSVPGLWSGQVVADWTGSSPNLSSAIFTLNVGEKL